MQPPLTGYPNETCISVLTENKQESISLWPISGAILENKTEIYTEYFHKPRYLIGFYNVDGLCDFLTI
jgi:hypothetical protein